MLVYIIEETIIGEVLKILKEEHIQSLCKETRPRLTHTRRFVFAVGSFTGGRESLYYQAYS